MVFKQKQILINKNNTIMKNISKLFFAAAFLTVGVASAQGGVGVGTTDPNTSSALDVTSTTKGFLMPRMTTAQRTAIASPAAGLQVYDTTTNTPWYYNGTIWVSLGTSVPGNPDTTTEVLPITSTTGKIWMDRNLGASRKAQSLTDYLAYGQLYQWGRGNDGHADITWASGTSASSASSTTTTISTTDNPGNSSFILKSASPFNWRSPQNDNLWQGVNGVNNPCPAGYRLPTAAELGAEVTAYNITNSAEAFASPLKFTVPGYRVYNTGDLANEGSYGYYWTSSVDGSTNAVARRYFSPTGTGGDTGYRASGMSVRCIKD